MFNSAMLRLSLALLLATVTFDPGTTFSGEMGQGLITFTQQITASAVDSDGVKVMFTDFAMSGVDYGTVGFASSIGCGMAISQVTTSAIKYTATVTAALATATVYTPGKGSPTSVTGAQSWSKVGDAVIVVLPTGTHQVTISYEAATTTTPGENPNPLKDLIPDLSSVTGFIDENVILISAGVIIVYILNQQPKRRGRRRR